MKEGETLDYCYTIGVCDDEIIIHNRVKILLQRYSNGRGLQIKTLHFASARELIENRQKMDILLLDIEMPETDGIEAGLILREHKTDLKIIMLTGRKDRMKEAFSIEASGFVEKPVDEKELAEALDLVLQTMGPLKTTQIYRDGIPYDVPQKKIVYIEANKAASLIVTKDREYRSENSLTEWEAILDKKYFFRCHKSYIINLGEIDSIHDNYAKMTNGYRVAISRREKKEFMRKYMFFDTRWR
jgi:DNA-binding LytR/AlgR family response regulator